MSKPAPHACITICRPLQMNNVNYLQELMVAKPSSTNESNIVNPTMLDDVRHCGMKFF
jgi:hypothetical protein